MGDHLGPPSRQDLDKMRFFTLLAFVGFAAASIESMGSGVGLGGSLSWEPGTEYTYDYQGRLLTGIPELASAHFSGVGIKCRLSLIVTRTGRIVLQIKEAEFARVNDELKSLTGGQEGNNWRFLPLTGYQRVPSESMQMLSKPTPFEVSESGKVSSIRLSHDEPEWSINFKKALIALFQTGLGHTSGVSSEGISSRVPSLSAPRTWTRYEQAPDGDCETKYEMMRCNPYTPVSTEEGSESSATPLKDVCKFSTSSEGGYRYQIIKTRNLDNCVKTSMFNFYKPGHLTCMPHKMGGTHSHNLGTNSYRLAAGSCGSLWTRSSVTRYGVSGTPDRFVIHTILNEGETNQHLMDYKTEKMLTGTRQSLRLVNKQRSSVSEESLLSGSFVAHESLLYSFGKKSGSQVSVESSGSDTEVHKVIESMKEIMGNGVKLSSDELVTKAKSLVKEIVEQDLLNPTILPESEMSWKVLTLSNAFTMLDRSMLQRVYEDVVRSYSGEKKDIAKNILVDTIVMSGKPEAIRFFKSLVERGELRSSQVSSIFFSLPRTIVMPTPQLLEDLFELVRSEPIRQMSKGNVWNMAILSFSGLLEKACGSPLAKENYPSQVFGRFCHKDSSIITQRWIPYLRSKLYQSETPVQDKNAIIVALGILSHEQIVPVVLDVLEGNLESPVMRREHNYHTTRYLSVYSLVSVGRIHPHKVLPIVSAIYSNTNEPTDIRIAAFNVIMALKPDMAIIQKIATLTWYEKDTEVLRAVNTAFYTLSNQVSMQDFASDMAVLIRRARIIYPLIKKTGGKFPSTATVFTSQFLTMLKVGYESTVNWISSEDSILPSYYHDKTKLFMTEEFRYALIEVGIHQRDIVPTLYEAISGLTETSSEEIKSKLSHEWRETIEKLRIKVRENRTPEAFFFMRLLEDSTLFTSLSVRSVEHLKNVLKNPRLLKEALSGENTFNWQRVMDLSPNEQMVPSDLGFPIYAEMRRPTVVSFRGRYTTDMLKSRESLARVETTFEVVVDRRITGRVGTLIPFTGEAVYSGIDEKAVGVVPFDIKVIFDMREGKLSASLKFTDRIRGMGTVEVLTHKVRPYTAVQKYFDLSPIFKTSGFKVIKSRSQIHTKEYEIGEYSGINMKLVYNTETPYLGTRYVLNKLSNLNYNPMNMIRFSGADYLGLTPTGLPSARHHESKLVALPQSSSTKEVEFVLKWGYATKEKGRPIIYHMMEPSQDTLVKMVSRPVGEMRSQVRRQEMVKKMIEKLQIDSEGKALTVSVSTILKGSRPRTFSYTGTVGTGQAGMTSKWDVELMSERTSKKICVRGEIRIPPYSIWKLSDIRSEDPVFRFHNTVGYGSECESKVQIVGYAKTSERQKQLARETPEAREFERLRSKGTPMIELSKLAELVRRQSSVLNVYDYKIKFVNVGDKVTSLSQSGLEALEFVWMPYYVPKDSHSWWPTSSEVSRLPIESIGSGYGSESWEMEVRTIVHPVRGSFDVEITNITRPDQKYKYRDVPMPYPFTYMYPVSYVTDPVSMGVKAVTGKPVYPVCTMEGKHISTFDNRTTKADMDDCFHLLSGDCSKAMSYGVLVRSLESSSSYSPESKKEVKIFIGRTDITMRPEGEHVIVKVNGSPIEVPTVERHVIKSEQGHIIAKIIMSKDNVMILKSSKISVFFDGKRVKLEGSNLLKNKLCGLCGDNNNKKIGDVPSPRQCLLSKPKLEVASYRVSLPSKQCSPLPSHLKEELERESERCVRFYGKPTGGMSSSISIMSGSESLSGSECMKHYHEVIDKHSRNEYCFSRIPLLECGSKCHSVGMREKHVSYTCMPKSDRRTMHILEKIRSGMILPELKNLPESFSIERPVPVECKPYSVYGAGSGNSLY